MPRLPASVAAADPWRPLTAARPLPDDTQSTLPPRAATCAAKSVGTEPLNVTMRRLFVAAPRATAANWGARAAVAAPVGCGGMRGRERKRLNSRHRHISYAVFLLETKMKRQASAC